MNATSKKRDPRPPDAITAQVRFLRAVDRLIQAADDARTERQRLLALIDQTDAKREGRRDA